MFISHITKNHFSQFLRLSSIIRKYLSNLQSEELVGSNCVQGDRSACCVRDFFTVDFYFLHAPSGHLFPHNSFGRGNVGILGEVMVQTTS